MKKRIDFHELFDSHSGHELFKYIREQLSGTYDYILLNAPAGHQEISGILCGQMADVILAIDVDNPAVEADASFQTCSKLAEQIPYYSERHVLKPGLTGWAQLNYPYGSSLDDAYQKQLYDMYYVKNHSLFLDCLILLQTVEIVLFGKGAR